MSNEEDYGPGPDDGIHDPGDYSPALTGLVLTGDVAVLQREVRALQRQVEELQDHNAELLRDKQALRAWCQEQQAVARTHRDAVAQTTRDVQSLRFRAYWLGHIDACHTLWQRIKPPDANESLDESSAPLESPGAATDH